LGSVRLGGMGADARRARRLAIGLCAVLPARAAVRCGGSGVGVADWGSVTGRAATGQGRRNRRGRDGWARDGIGSAALSERAFDRLRVVLGLCGCLVLLCVRWRRRDGTGRRLGVLFGRVDCAADIGIADGGVCSEYAASIRTWRFAARCLGACGAGFGC
jgi:hypothetical protein